MILATLLNLCNLFDSSNGLLPSIAIIFDGDIATFLELEAGINGQLLAMSLAICLCPCYLAWVLLLFKCLVTFSTTEFEDLRIAKANSMYISTMICLRIQMGTIRIQMEELVLALQSLRTKCTPCPGYILLEQK